MTDEQQESLDQESNTPDEDNSSPESLGTDEIDVESALAAISSLHDLTREEDAESKTEDEAHIEALEHEPALRSDMEEIEAELAEAEPDEDEEGDEAEYTEVESIVSDFPHPPLSVLHRGQLASIVPAALLIGAGALLTVMLTTSADATLNLPLVGSLVVSGLGLALVTHWFSSARWTTGSLFVGITLLLMGLAVAYLILPNNLDVVQGWPLLFTAIGLAFVLTDLISPTNRRVWLVGLIFAIASFAAMVITGQLLDESIIQTLSGFWPVASVVIGLLLIVPLLRRDG